MTEIEIFVEKDEENQLPIPTVWRPIFVSIVDAFVKKDYSLSCEIDGVASVSKETANHIKEYIEDYGEELIQLPNETWESSICICMSGHWDVLIDLWTAGEGRSDLVLGARISESKNGYIVDIEMVYVP
ncbi:hypothetical protein HQN60_11550 [Deefgea piscis]|uniref:DUF7668 domain-containing protein n=1 Tax=Deefgea piscis TaxID=2739061 RepID=A0A6M8ST30_9NEIS|nr:hypothetical protein [Deefgea piscis]QKJ67284.1 hypothetical protein HQN60_11550 [Deefgea piscis]